MYRNFWGIQHYSSYNFSEIYTETTWRSGKMDVGKQGLAKGNRDGSSSFRFAVAKCINKPDHRWLRSGGITKCH
jgi:hypothetical protein